MRKTIAIALVLLALFGAISMSIITSYDSELDGVSQEFLQAVQTSNNQFSDCNRLEDTSECGSEQSPDSIFGGSLDPILARRDAVLQEKNILFLGSWSTGAFHSPFGYDSPSTSGLYVPLAPCRLDSLPAWMRSAVC